LAAALCGPESGPEHVDGFVAACQRHLGLGTGDPGAYSLAASLAKRFPGDPGVAASALMCHVSLAPGEAVFLPPGVLHGYLRGVAVEIMGPSDNVLRAGLTDKYTDPARVLSTIDFAARAPVRPQVVRDGPARVLRPPTKAFQLADVRVAGSYGCGWAGPRIVVALEGGVTAFTDRGSLHLSRGQSLFALAGEGPMELRGRGRVIMAGKGRI
jgi:mannose-6-phosphate isomerase